MRLDAGSNASFQRTRRWRPSSSPREWRFPLSDERENNGESWIGETDGRGRDQWASRYPTPVKCQIWAEAAFVTIVLLGALTGIYLTWNGYLPRLLGCATCSGDALQRYLYFFFAGLLGNILFGGKYLYHVVAHGYWNQDRRLWRVLSPILAASVAVMVAVAIDSGMLGVAFRVGSHASCVAMGFFSGYFADKALAKMTEIANVIFAVDKSKKNGGDSEG